jgi:hypothetical protein
MYIAFLSQPLSFQSDPMSVVTLLSGAVKIMVVGISVEMLSLMLQIVAAAVAVLLSHPDHALSTALGSVLTGPLTKTQRNMGALFTGLIPLTTWYCTPFECMISLPIFMHVSICVVVTEISLTAANMCHHHA